MQSELKSQLASRSDTDLFYSYFHVFVVVVFVVVVVFDLTRRVKSKVSPSYPSLWKLNDHKDKRWDETVMVRPEWWARHCRWVERWVPLGWITSCVIQSDDIAHHHHHYVDALSHVEQVDGLYTPTRHQHYRHVRTVVWSINDALTLYDVSPYRQRSRFASSRRLMN